MTNTLSDWIERLEGRGYLTAGEQPELLAFLKGLGEGRWCNLCEAWGDHDTDGHPHGIVAPNEERRRLAEALQRLEQEIYGHGSLLPSRQGTSYERVIEALTDQAIRAAAQGERITVSDGFLKGTKERLDEVEGALTRIANAESIHTAGPWAVDVARAALAANREAK